MNSEAEVRATAKRTNVAPGRHNKEKLAVWFFLGGEVILFTTLILTFGLFRIHICGRICQFQGKPQHSPHRYQHFCSDPEQLFCSARAPGDPAGSGKCAAYEFTGRAGVGLAVHCRAGV